MNIMSEQIGELSKALSKAQAQMLNASEDSANPFYKSKYADYNAIRTAVKKPLTDNGLSWVHLVQPMDGQMSVITILMHESGQWIKSIFPITMPVDSSGRIDVQKMGSAITYLKRYSLSAITGCGTGENEDDDGEKAMEEHREREKKFTFESLKAKISHSDITLKDIKDYITFIAIRTKKSDAAVIEQAFGDLETFVNKLLSAKEKVKNAQE